jgi:hypothetical protein
MDDGNAWASSHQTFDDLIPCGFNSYGSENLHHKGKDQGNGFSLMDDRVIEGRIVHLHGFFSSGYQWCVIDNPPHPSPLPPGGEGDNLRINLKHPPP